MLMKDTCYITRMAELEEVRVEKIDAYLAPPKKKRYSDKRKGKAISEPQTGYWCD